MFGIKRGKTNPYSGKLPINMQKRPSDIPVILWWSNFLTMIYLCFSKTDKKIYSNSGSNFVPAHLLNAVIISSWLRLTRRWGYLSTFVGACHICKPAAWPPGSTISGLSLPQEHLDLVEKHFPTEEALTEYLCQKGIQLKKNTSG